MAGEWSEATLGDLIDIKHGFAFKGQFIHDNSNGDVLLTPGNFAIGGGFKGEKYKYYKGPTQNEYVLHEGDLLVTMTDLSKQSDTLGYPAFVPPATDGRRYLHNQRLGKVSPKEKAEIDRRYIYYVMCTAEYRHEVLASATGTTVKHTSPERIKKYRFLLPPPAEQRAIAYILGTLDDKIGLNQSRIQTLEEMVSTLFKSWFVDFDPVRAKMEGQEMNLPKSIADMFPGRFTESGIGIIPDQWRTYRLRELVDHHTKSVTPSLFPESMFEHFSIPAHDSGRLPSMDRGSDIKSNKTVVPCGAVLLSKLNPEISRVWIPSFGRENLQICSTEFLAFTPRYPANRSLLYSLFSNPEFGMMLQSMVTGTSKSHQRVLPPALKQSKVLSGTPTIFHRYGDLVAPMLASVVESRTEALTLAALRDALLPKLMFGGLSVKDADTFFDRIP